MFKYFGNAETLKVLIFRIFFYLGEGGGIIHFYTKNKVLCDLCTYIVYGGTFGYITL